MKTKLNNYDIVIFYIIAIIAGLVINGCESDDQCECKKETYNTSSEFQYDQHAESSKCNGDTALRMDGYGGMYRYTCK